MLEIEVMLDRQDIEAIAAAIAPRVAAELQAQSFPSRGFVKAEQVASFLKVDVSWVYEHKHRLGAIRIGEGAGCAAIIQRGAETRIAGKSPAKSTTWARRVSNLRPLAREARREG